MFILMVMFILMDDVHPNVIIDPDGAFILTVYHDVCSSSVLNVYMSCIQLVYHAFSLFVSRLVR